MASEITEKGPKALRGIRNQDLYPNSTKGTGMNLSDEELQEIKNLAGAATYANYDTAHGHMGYSSLNNPSTYTPIEREDLGNYGESRYDQGLMYGDNTSSDINEIRYENQSDLDRLANGYAKMFGTAASTFISSLIGLPYGAVQAAREGRWSALWDNDVTQALGDFDNWLEENNTNYKSQRQQNSPWYDPSNLLSMNWLADDIIKNAGFMVGASASMAVGAGALGLMSKSLGLVNNVSKGAMMTNNFLSSLFSATGEGMIEARQGVEERNKLEEQRLNDALAPEYASLEEQEALAAQEYSFTGDYDTYSERLRNIVAQKQVLDQRKEVGMQQIQESGLEMGNKILLGNQILLTAGNMIQFSNLMTSGFNNARHAAETAVSHSSPFLVGAKRAGESLASGYRIFGKNLGKTYAAFKGLVTEGSEEMNQQWIQSASGAAYDEEDANDYWKAKLDPESYKDTVDGLYAFGTAVSKGFSESWGDIDQWEQFVVGGLTGMAGSWAPTKIFNQDKSRSIVDPRRYGDWEGGAYNEVRAFNKAYNQYEENINALNKILADGNFETRILDSVGHTYNEKKKGSAALDDDKKAWKDADDKQNILDIQAFSRAGKLDDLRAIYDEMGKNLSDEDIEGIVRRTTQFVSQEEDKKNHFAELDARIANAATPEEKAALEAEKAADNYEGKSYHYGAFVDENGNQTLTNDQIRKEVQENVKEYQRKLDSYLESINAVNEMTGGRLTNDQEDNLAYLHNLSKESTERFNSIMSKIRKQLPSKFLFKTDKSPEQLSKESVFSDLVFTKDDNTKKGYVEVDTSLMDDKTFGIFFASNIIEGNNIQGKDSKEDDKSREEQLRENEKLIKDNFVKNAVTKEGKPLVDALNSKELKDLIQNINDATALRQDASKFYSTYLEYMANPSKVEKAKEKAANNAAKKEEKDKLDKASMDEMMNMDAATLSKAMRGKSGKKAKKAVGLKEGISEIEKEINKKLKRKEIDEETASDAMKLASEQARRIKENDDEYDLPSSVAKGILESDTEVMNDPEILLSDEELEAISNEEQEVDYEALERRLSKAKDALSSVSSSVSKVMEEVDNLITSGKYGKSLDDTEKDIASADEVSKARSNENKETSPNMPKTPKREGESPEQVKSVSSSPAPSKVQKTGEEDVTYEGDTDSVKDDMVQGTKGNNIPSSEKIPWHPWMSSTSEFGHGSNEPYQPSGDDLNGEFKKKRYDAIRKKLLESGAYTARTEGKIKEGMTVGFKVFQDVNDEAGDFVIFITDATGKNIIGDLPSNDPRADSSKRDVSMDAIYEAIRKEWEEASDDERKDGMESQYSSVVEHVLVGKVLYGEDRQTVEELFNGSEQQPKFALLTKSSFKNGMLFSGRSKRGTAVVDNILFPKNGKVGTAYVLIKTPGMHKSRGGFNYYAVPLTTKTIGELDDNTMFMRVLRELLRRIKYSTQDKSNDFTDAAAKKLLQALIAVNNVHINLSENSDTKTGLGIKVTKDGQSYTIYSGKREDMDIESIIKNLSRFNVNVSGDYINGSDSKDLRKFLTIDGKSLSDSDYNKIISGVVYTNAARTTTVNDWFTVKPLERKDGTLKMTEKRDKLPEWEDVSGNTWKRIPILKNAKQAWTVRITADGYKVYDERGIEIIPEGDEDKLHNDTQKNAAWRMAAEVFGEYNMKPQDEKYTVYIWGKTRIYDPTDHTFVAESKITKSPGYIKRVEELTKREGRKPTEEEKYRILDSLFNGYYVSQITETPSSGNKETDHSQEVYNKVAEMEEESSHYHLVKWDEASSKYIEDPEGDYYQDDRDGSVNARVSNVNDADIDVITASNKAGFTINNPAKVPATGAGNVVDSFTRRFYADHIKEFDGLDLGKKEDMDRAKQLAVTVGNTLRNENISEKDATNLVLSLVKVKKALGQDWEINSSGIVVDGLVKFDDGSIVHVAGTLDLLAYNPKTGEYQIIDMKSSHAEIFSKNGNLKKDVRTNAKLAHWRAQQTLYKEFIEKKYGIKISKIMVMPFKVDYSTNFTDTLYEFKDGVLTDHGIAIDIQPSYMGRLQELKPKKTVKYNTAKLSDTVKRILSNDTKAAAKPKEEKQPAKGKLADILNSIPEGRKITDFIKDDYKSNSDVLNLAKILEDNKGNSNPIMATSASWQLLLNALDMDAIDKAAQEAKAAKEDLKIEVPVKESKEESIDDALQRLKSKGKITDRIEEIIRELPDDLQQFVVSDDDALDAVTDMAELGSIEEIEEHLRDMKSTTLHKKKTSDNYQKLDLAKEMRWLTKNLPQISRERRLQIVKGLIACSDGSMDFGRVEHGIITVSEVAETGTFYHEAFHYVTQFLMTDEELEQLYKAAINKYGKMPVVALEERLADDFADYIKGIEYEDNRIKRFFKELWEAIKSMFNNKSYIQNIYRNINTGVYSGREFKNDRNNSFMAVDKDSREVAKDYEYLTEDERDRIKAAGVSEYQYNNLSKREKEYMLHCIV